MIVDKNQDFAYDLGGRSIGAKKFLVVLQAFGLVLFNCLALLSVKRRGLALAY